MANNEVKQHSVLLEDRKRMTLSGVKEVKSFSENAVTLKTDMGDMLISGRGLNIGRLNTDTGELFVSGEVTLIRYSKDKSKRSLFEGMFK